MIDAEKKLTIYDLPVRHYVINYSDKQKIYVDENTLESIMAHPKQVVTLRDSQGRITGIINKAYIMHVEFDKERTKEKYIKLNNQLPEHI